MFTDNLWEPDLGTRQCKWLDYLQYHTPEPIKATCEYRPGKYSPWEPYNHIILPTTHRQILPYEEVIEFDSPDRDENYACSRRIYTYLKHSTIPHYLEDHNGKSPHIHIFKITEEEHSLMLRWARVGAYDKQLKPGHMIREIGGRYKDTQNLSSVFQRFEDIHTITNPKEVQFPTINMIRENGRKEENQGA